jgi:hypothetical protein
MSFDRTLRWGRLMGFLVLPRLLPPKHIATQEPDGRQGFLDNRMNLGLQAKDGPDERLKNS